MLNVLGNAFLNIWNILMAPNWATCAHPVTMQNSSDDFESSHE